MLQFSSHLLRVHLSPKDSASIQLSSVPWGGLETRSILLPLVQRRPQGSHSGLADRWRNQQSRTWSEHLLPAPLHTFCLPWEKDTGTSAGCLQPVF